MIWGHCIQHCAKGSFDFFDNAVYRFIYSFHMPLFMMISGYLFYYSFQKRDLKTLLVHRTQNMLQPIVFGNMLNVLLAELPTLILHGSMHIFNGALLNSLYSLWFLWCVLSSSTAVAIAGKKGKTDTMQIIYLLLGMAFVALFPENYYHIFMYPYFVAGFLYGKYRSRIPANLVKISRLAIIIFPMMLPFYENHYYIYITPIFTQSLKASELLWINGFRWSIGFAGSLFVLTVTWILFSKQKADRFRCRIFAFLAKLGENSLTIYCISIPLLSYYLSKVYDRFLLVAGRNIFAENMLLFNFVFTPILSVLYCFLLYYVVIFMKKIRIHRIIYGR